MKIVCDACSAKYSIADEKVRGKVFKISCKKCSNIIVVRGSTGDEPQQFDQKEPKVFDSRQAAIDSCAWMLHQLTPSEQETLGRYFDEILQANPDGTWSMAGQVQPKWAFISFTPSRRDPAFQLTSHPNPQE